MRPAFDPRLLRSGANAVATIVPVVERNRARRRARGNDESRRRGRQAEGADDHLRGLVPVERLLGSGQFQQGRGASAQHRATGADVARGLGPTRLAPWDRQRQSRGPHHLRLALRWPVDARGGHPALALDAHLAPSHARRSLPWGRATALTSEVLPGLASGFRLRLRVHQLARDEPSAKDGVVGN